MKAFEESAPGYLLDLCRLLKAAARKAKDKKDRCPQADRDFALGRLMAYHEVMSLIQQQALAFDLDLADLGLDDVDPERDLL